VRLFHFAVALPLLFGLLWWSGVRPSILWLLLPGLACIQFLLTVGLAYPLASVNVMFRDTQHIVGAVLQIYMFLTPVFYSVQSIPVHLRSLYYLNPMVTLIEAWRDVLLRGLWPDLFALGAWTAVGIFVLIFGRGVFIAQSHRFVEEL
jgi:lipopolysaccharide transport system permease protein